MKSSIKHTIKILCGLAAAAVLVSAVSCTRETNSYVPDSINQEIALRTMGGLPTRSAIDGTAFPQGYDMMVSAFRNLGPNAGSSDSAHDYFQNIRFGYDGTAAAWKSEMGAKYYPLDGTLDFLALASAGFNVAANGIAPSLVWGESSNVAKKVVATVPDNSAKFDDLLYSSANGEGMSASGTNMTFKHAMTSVVFNAHCNVAYNATTNAGITIDGITIDGAKYSGTLTVSNPGAGGGSGEMSAAWSSLGSQQEHIAARVWNSANLGTNANESALTNLNLTTTSKDIASYPFGEGYVILPPQDAVPFTITYTVHNGFQADNTTPLNKQMKYKYTPEGTWDMGKKNVYDIEFNLTEILISPTVVPWGFDSADVEDVKIPEPPALPSFGGLQIAPGPLQYTGGQYVMTSEWSVNSYNSIRGKNEGSTYFNYLEMGELFEKTGFNNSDGNIENVLDPFDGWRLPTEDEVAFLGACDNPLRSGSIVNGITGVKIAKIQLTGISLYLTSSPRGMLIFPDNKTIIGKTLTYYNTTGGINSGFTIAELNEYLEQGCAFIPFASYINNWTRDYCIAWSSTNNDNNIAIAFSPGQSYATCNKSYYLQVRLVKPI